MIKNNVVYAKIPRIDPGIMQQFKEVGVASVHEAMGMTQLMSQDIRPVKDGLKLVGQAVTCFPYLGDNLMLHVAVEVASPGDVIVVGSEGIKTCACWGEMITVCAMEKGIAGVVADGAVRDVAYYRSKNFPVWSNSINARGGVKVTPRAVNVPIVCGDVIVNPGDVIVADDDGVAVVPYQDYEAVLKAALEREEQEEQLKNEIQETGKTIFALKNMKAALSNVRWIDDTYRHDQEQQ